MQWNFFFPAKRDWQMFGVRRVHYSLYMDMDLLVVVLIGTDKQVETRHQLANYSYIAIGLLEK